MRAALVLVLALAACDGSRPAAQRPDPNGQAARVQLDKLSAVYGDCVTAKARVVPVTGELAGTVAFALQDQCRANRAPLFAATSAFYQAGHPKASRALADAVADASIKGLEDDIRSRAVIIIVQRQNGAKVTG